MTNAQRQQSRRLVLLAILVVAVMFGVALAAVGPSLFDDIAAQYGQRVYEPDRAEYCPGDAMRFAYTVQPVSPGQVEIMTSWRNVDRRTTLLAETQRQHANIWEAAPAPIQGALTVTIPVSPQMLPGSNLQYVRSVRKLGQSDSDMFAVPFRIAGDCP